VANWAIQLGNHGIDDARYHELKWICRQYDKYRDALAAMRRGETDKRNAGNSVWHGRPDPVAYEAMRLADSFEAARINAIEQAAVAADPQLCRYILANVARDISFEKLNVPCGRNQFFEARRKFFIELDDRLRF